MQFSESVDDAGQLRSVHLKGRGTLARRIFAVGVHGKQEMDEGHLEAGTTVWPAGRPSEPLDDFSGRITDAWVFVSPGPGHLTQRVAYRELRAAIEASKGDTEEDV